MVNYLASIRLMTYNHAPFIRKTMEGIMMQEVDFPIEVVVGDDFSDDGTLDIIREYDDTVNIHIKILKREKGDEYWQKRQEKGRLYNLVNIIKNCTGKYIALLDGDDYWTDSLKLQKQVEFLEENSNYYLCFHDVFIKRNGILNNNNISLPTNDISNIKTLLSNRNYIHTPSVLLRSDFEIPQWALKSPIGDYLLYIIASKGRKIKYLDDKMAVYRHGIGIQSSLDKSDKIKNWVTCLLLLHKNLEGEYKRLLKENIIRELCLIVSEDITYEEEWYNKVIASVLTTREDIRLFLNCWEDYRKKKKGKFWKFLQKIKKI